MRPPADLTARMAERFTVYYSPRQRLHEPAGHPESPERCDVLLAAAVEWGLTVQEPADLGLGPITAVHTIDLVDLLRTAYEEFARLPEGPRPAVPDTFPVREKGRYTHVPRNIWARLGHHCTDTLTPILPRTWDAAYWSAQSALGAAVAVDGGATLAYGLCRPPGHHAYRDLYGGYCYLNNAAIAAAWLAERGRRPAILDIDYHHGNGTQALFYDRADVFFCSLHADPEDEYPYYSGYAGERGRGRGAGRTLNLPLPRNSGETAYLQALDRALSAIQTYDPDLLILSLGFDTLAGDPHGGLKLAPSSFRTIGRALASLNRPLLLIQEGGYLLAQLGPALLALLDGISRVG